MTDIVKLTRLSGSARDVIETSYESGLEIEAEECKSVTITATTVSGTPEFFDRIAEDFEMAAGDRRCGHVSIAHECFSRDMSAEFAEAADERIAKGLDGWARKCHRLGTPEDPYDKHVRLHGESVPYNDPNRDDHG